MQFTISSYLSLFLVKYKIIVCLAVNEILGNFTSREFAGGLCICAIMAAQSLMSKSLSNPRRTREPFLIISADGLGQMFNDSN